MIIMESQEQVQQQVLPFYSEFLRKKAKCGKKHKNDQSKTETNMEEMEVSVFMDNIIGILYKMLI